MVTGSATSNQEMEQEGTRKVNNMPAEIIFEVTEAVEGGYDARALGYSIFTQGGDWADLKEMVRDAIRCHFEDECMPKVVRLHLV